MENIKLVLCDIDGTLINSEQAVTSRTIQAISKLKEKNIQFGIATGRTPFSVINLIKDWGIENYVDLIMGFNGGCYYNLKTQQMKSYYLLEGKYISEILNDFKDFNTNAGIYDGKTIHCLKDDILARKIADSNHFPLIVDDFKHYSDKKIEKILFIARAEIITAMEEYYYKSVQTKHYKIVRSSDILLECLNPKLSKSKGIEKICKELNISFNNVLAFGDELNDYEMIRDCIGVAMGNANPKIKEIAKYITKSNNDDGIAVFLENNIL